MRRSRAPRQRWKFARLSCSSQPPVRVEYRSHGAERRLHGWLVRGCIQRDGVHSERACADASCLCRRARSQCSRIYAGLNIFRQTIAQANPGQPGARAGMVPEALRPDRPGCTWSRRCRRGNGVHECEPSTAMVAERSFRSCARCISRGNTSCERECAALDGDPGDERSARRAPAHRAMTGGFLRNRAVDAIPDPSAMAAAAEHDDRIRCRIFRSTPRRSSTCGRCIRAHSQGRDFTRPA
jgi:hypothetical protein